MFNKIQNPETGNWVNVNGPVGRRVLQNYSRQFGGMAGMANDELQNMSSDDIKLNLEKARKQLTIETKEATAAAMKAKTEAKDVNAVTIKITQLEKALEAAQKREAKIKAEAEAKKKAAAEAEAKKKAAAEAKIKALNRFNSLHEQVRKCYDNSGTMEAKRRINASLEIFVNNHTGCKKKTNISPPKPY